MPLARALRALGADAPRRVVQGPRFRCSAATAAQEGSSLQSSERRPSSRIFCCRLWRTIPIAFAVREMLPTEPVAVLPRYGNMPLCREFRCFVDDGLVRCVHPYWPREAVTRGMIDVPADFDELYDSLNELSGPDESSVRQLASRAGEAVKGSWSVDILHTSKGWYVTDMAIARQSFHWEGCEKAVAVTRAVRSHNQHEPQEAPLD